ncbi:MAG TPA: tetratricopeptide repeat protein [Candidatus Omnitrophota bacterium]|nr:tetratricopeptide repeat protein [Candidatus Omnitrophota bacterium]HPT06939.1 tetratricopeptide repeat protein [Candidatus Omnitrophota bacterium]
MNKFHGKKQLVIILVVILTTGILWKKFFTFEELEKDYSLLSYYYLTHRITDPYPFTRDKIQALISYIHQNMFQPEVPVKDLRPLDNLIRGVGWCDQMSAVFIRLLSDIDIRGYLVFLKNNPDGSGFSPHTIAVITPSVKEELGADTLFEKGLVVDNLRGELAQTRDGSFATMKDIAEGNIALQQVKIFEATAPLYRNKFQIFGVNTPISLRIKKVKYAYRYYIFSIVPRPVVYAFQDFMLQWYFKKGFKKESDFLLFKARNYHIYGRFDDAFKVYEEVIKNSPNNMNGEKALIFQVRVLLKEGKNNEAIALFESFIRKYPDHPWQNIMWNELNDLLLTCSNSVNNESPWKY